MPHSVAQPTSAVAFFLLAAAAGAEIQTQHAFDTSLDLGRLEPLWHLRLRTKPRGGGLFQVRTGPILEFDLNERVTAIGGYYYTREEQEERRWSTTNRAFAGGELALWNRTLEIDWRSLLERFFVSGQPDF